MQEDMMLITGLFLVNKGKGNFSCENLNGLIIKGEVRHIRPIKIGKEFAYILAKNNSNTEVIKFVPLLK